MGRNKRIYKDEVDYFIITNIWNNIPLFTDEKTCNILKEKIWIYQKKYKFYIYSYSISPCHLNILFKPVFGKQISDIIHDIKGATANNIKKLLNNNLLLNYEYICNKQCHCKFAEINKEVVAQGYKTLCYQLNQPHYVHYYRNADNKIKSIKIINPGTAKLENFKLNNKFWENGFYDHYIRNQNEFIKKIKYIYFNNNKHCLDEKYNRLFIKYRYISPKYKNLLK
ncbi:MAG: transposase [Patescibacteria group bacterium]